MKNFNNIIISFLLVVALILVSACTTKVKKTDYLTLWTDNATVKNELISYVKNVTDTKSSDFIPEVDRVAVFDMDGTLFCETDPVYYEYMMLFEYILDDYKKTGNHYTLVSEIKKALETGVISDELELKLSDLEYEYYLNFNINDYKKHIKEFLDKDTISYSNMKIKDALYKPMLEIIKYLQDNNFSIHVVSGTERNFVREVVCDKSGIRESNVIGMDFKYKARGQKNLRNSEYQYTRGEDILISGKPDDVNIKSHTVYEISEEIGIVPVLAFGNSIGDSSMLEYTLGNDKYKSMGFMVICDDRERENGNPDKAKGVKDLSDEKGYITISMKDDWKTIYGDGIEKIGR